MFSLSAMLTVFAPVAFGRRQGEGSAANDGEHAGMLATDTAKHMRELRGIVGSGEVHHCCTATLRCWTIGKESHPAVHVTIAGKLVGQLGLEAAQAFVRRYGKAARSCRAAIIGQSSEPWHLDVWLDLNL